MIKRAFEIFTAELGGSTRPEPILQMAVKAVNDTAGPDGLVPTLLVFGAYPRQTAESNPTPPMAKRAKAVFKAMKELRKLRAKQTVNDALNTRNGPSDLNVLILPLQSDIRVWREIDGWSGPYKLTAKKGHTLTLELPNGPTDFRTLHCREYFRPHNLEDRPPPDPGEAETQAPSNNCHSRS